MPSDEAQGEVCSGSEARKVCGGISSTGCLIDRQEEHCQESPPPGPGHPWSRALWSWISVSVLSVTGVLRLLEDGLRRGILTGWGRTMAGVGQSSDRVE